jgi:hypothetical protein
MFPGYIPSNQALAEIAQTETRAQQRIPKTCHIQVEWQLNSSIGVIR